MSRKSPVDATVVSARALVGVVSGKVATYLSGREQTPGRSSMIKPLHEQVVVITGASSGIGRETALLLAAKGAQVVAAARGEEALDTLIAEITDNGGEATAFPTDVSKWSEVSALATFARERYGRIDTWVNNAGVLIVGEFEKTSIKEARALFDTNFWGELYGMKAALPVMRAQGYGTIINVTSVTAKRAFPLMSIYSASKAALNRLHEGVLTEIKTPDIHICTIMPATIDTPLYDHARTKEGLTPKGAPPLYPPSEVANAIAECAVRPRREMYAGRAGALMAISNEIMPGVLDKLLAATGRTALLKKDAPKTSRDADNLDAPLGPETDATTGGQRGRRTELVELVPRILLGVVALFAARRLVRR
ncbi:MAG TPA: SDR family oxidoreductase [Chloroflexia bacterium]|nr:SDR family oxidoreductase [Chloroflexia bacterium]